MKDRLAEATPRLRDNNYGAGETGSAPSRSTAWYSEWLSLNIHLHCLVLDGVYRTNAKGEPVFVEMPPPSDEQVWEVLERIIKRVMKQLVRRGILVEDQGETYLADDGDDSEESRTLRPLHRGSCVYRIAFGPRAGQKVLTLQGALPREISGKQKLCANPQGFSSPEMQWRLVIAVQGHRTHPYSHRALPSRQCAGRRCFHPF